MKRDLDLARKLLFDVERHGSECSLEALRNGAPQEVDDCVRYHLRLLCDAGLVKELDRPSCGLPSFRLTNAGHELLELSRSDARWREAKWIVHERTGGLSLTVLRGVLVKWAVEAFAESERYRRWRRRERPHFRRDLDRGEPGYRVVSYRYEREPDLDPCVEEEPARWVRRRYESREPAGLRDRWEYDVYAPAEEHFDGPLGVSLPVYMI